MLRANHSCCALASDCLARALLPVCLGMPPATTEETDLVQELRALLSTERGGVRLSSVVIELLVTHYVQSGAAPSEYTRCGLRAVTDETGSCNDVTA